MRRVDSEKDTVICDLDGTIALDIHRSWHLHPPHAKDCPTPGVTSQVACPSCGRKKRDWESYFRECGGDEPNWAVIHMLRLLWEDGYNIRLLTGRNSNVSVLTEEWLRSYSVPYHTIKMRADGDFTDDHILKPKWAEEAGYFPSNTLVVFEDRQRVVDAWRVRGYDVFQVAPGNF